MKQVAVKAYASGIPRPETVVEGIDALPAAFSSVFSGNSSVGKLLVKVAEAE